MKGKTRGETKVLINRVLMNHGLHRAARVPAIGLIKSVYWQLNPKLNTRSTFNFFISLLLNILYTDSSYWRPARYCSITIPEFPGISSLPNLFLASFWMLIAYSKTNKYQYDLSEAYHNLSNIVLFFARL